MKKILEQNVLISGHSIPLESFLLTIYFNTFCDCFVLTGSGPSKWIFFFKISCSSVYSGLRIHFLLSFYKNYQNNEPFIGNCEIWSIGNSLLVNYRILLRVTFGDNIHAWNQIKIKESSTTLGTGFFTP